MHRDSATAVQTNAWRPGARATHVRLAVLATVAVVSDPPAPVPTTSLTAFAAAVASTAS